MLLGLLTKDFIIDAVDVNEVAPRALSVHDALEVIARKKALAASRRQPDRMVLAGDTVVHYRDVLVGKARSTDEARTRLATLSGETHEVVTGLALAYNGRAIDAEAATTQVTFARLTPDLVDSYVRSDAWVGKAGGYGIQDAALAPFITIDGPWSNVVGLPLAATAALLRRNDVQCRDPPEESWLRDHNPFDGTN